MKLSKVLYESVEEIWKSYLCHPFVKQLGEGTLSPDIFRYYMIQDYLYLLEYSKVFALGVVKSKQEKLMRKFASMVHNTLNGEMNIHKIYMERLGISEQEVSEAQQSLANRSYTSYMLEVAYNGDALGILVAILSCAWSYQVIGEHHVNIPNALQHPLYGEWVKGYSSEEYRKDTEELIALTDELGKDISQNRIEELKTVFIHCSRYEYAFWDMSYKKEM
ncbi:MAG: thiaminase II [Firmicutes bacterium]|jgi:thiaminase/transcriptional activator TenA|nr:thiaminase II [Bacillota bacterium]